MLRAPDFDLAELCWRWAYLELERRAWDAGLELLDIASELHGPAGLPGPSSTPIASRNARILGTPAYYLVRLDACPSAPAS